MRSTASALFGAILLALPAVAMAQNGNLRPATAGPHPNQHAMAKGLFPPNEPLPPYRTGANNPNASMTVPNAHDPNAGNTGYNPTGKSYGYPSAHQ